MNSAIAVAVALFASALAACTPPTPGAATDVQSAEQPDDAIRAAATEALQADIGQPIGLNIETLRTEGDWAWVIATPMTPSGEAVDFSATKYGQAVADGVFDGGGTTYMLLQRRADGGWAVVEFVVGPTDVAWLEWPAKYGFPPSLFGSE